MPRIYEAATGRPVEVSDAEAPALLASGKFGFAGDTVALVGPTGQVIGLKADSPNILDALGSGFRIETPDEGKLRLQQAKYGDSEGLAALAGAGRGLTFGLSDVALTKTGLVAPETLEGLRAANPTATALGEGGAIAASLLMPGGAFAAAGKAGKAALGATAAVRGVSRLGAGIERSIVGALATEKASPLAKAMLAGAGAAAGGAVEAGLYSTGQIISEHALGDIDVNAEHILSHVGAGALLGGAAGGLFGAMKSITPEASRVIREASSKATAGVVAGAQAKAQALAVSAAKAKATAEVSQEAILEITGGLLTKEGRARRLAIEALPAQKKVIADKLYDGLRQTLRHLDDASEELFSGVRPAARAEALAEISGDFAKREAQKIVASGERFIDKLRANPDIYTATPLIGRLARQVKGVADEEGEDALGGIVERLKKADTADEVFDAMDAFKRRMQQQIKEYGKRASSAEMETLNAIRGYQNKVQAHLEDVNVYGRAAENQVVTNRAFSRYQTARDLFLDTFGTLRPGKRGKVKVLDPVKLNTYLGQVTDTRGEFRRQALDGFLSESQRFASMLEQQAADIAQPAIGAAAVRAGAQGVGAAHQEAGRVLGDLARYRGFDPFDVLGLAKITQGASYVPGLSRVAVKLQGQAKGAAMAQAGALAKAEGLAFAIGGASAKAASKALDLSTMGTMQGAATARKLLPALLGEIAAPPLADRGREFESRASRMVALERTIRDSDTAIGDAVGSVADAVMRDRPAKGTTAKPPSNEDLIAFADHLDRVASDPVRMAELVHERFAGVEEVAPNIAQAMSQKAMSALLFLQQHVPQPLPSASLTPLAGEPVYPQGAVDKFGKYVAAVRNPLSVLQDIAAGNFNTEGVETLRTLYPRIYQQTVQKLVAKIASSKTPLSYNDSVRLGLMFGLPTDASMTPEFIRSMQNSAAQASAQNEAEKRQNGGIRMGGIESIGSFAPANMTQTQRISGGL